MLRGTPAILALLLLAPAATMLADAIPYPNPGNIAPQMTVTATGSDGINIYFDGSGASYTDYVEVYDPATGYNSGQILNNHTTALGAEVTVGSTAGQINAGDQLVFYIESPDGQFASVAADSDDGVNHAYITDYSGGTIGSTAVGPGIYVGLEDEAAYHSDFNYQDDTFVFTNVAATSVTPEPGSVALFGTGLLGVAGMIRRRARSLVA